MTAKQFKQLKIGDRVRLTVARPDYSCGHKTPDGRMYIPVGTVGVIGVVNVPFVSGPNRKQGFACLDVPAGSFKFENCNGVRAVHWSETQTDQGNFFRCAVVAEEIELV